MSPRLKIVRVVLVLLGIPGVLVTLIAGGVAASLLRKEFFPDPTDVAHGMAMLGLVPLIVWAILAVGYLVFLWLVWVVVKATVRRRQESGNRMDHSQS